MSAIGFLAVAYVCIAYLALIMTYEEQRRVKMKGVVFRFLGVLACLFWPVTFLVAIAAVQRSKA